MRGQKITVLQNTFTGFNDSGEELYSYEDTGKYILGKVTFAGGDDSYTSERNASVTTIKIYSSKIYDWLSRKDRIVYRGKEWVISAVPEAWENSRGYRDAFVVTAVSVEG